MDINVFLTTQASQGQTGKQTGAIPAATGNGQGIFGALQGLNFMDLIFARLAETPKEAGTAEGAPEDTPLKSNNPTLIPLSGLTVTEAQDNSALPVVIEGNGEQALLVTLEDSKGLLANVHRRKPFIEALESLLAGVPEGEKPAIDVQLGNLVRKADLGASADTKSFPALVSTGLSPEELETLMEQFGRDVLQQYEGNENVEGVMMGVVKIMPPESHAPFDAILMPRALFVQKTSGNSAGTDIEAGITGSDTDTEEPIAGLAAAANTMPNPQAVPTPAPTGTPLTTPAGTTDTLASQLNSLIVGGDDNAYVPDMKAGEQVAFGKDAGQQQAPAQNNGAVQNSTNTIALAGMVPLTESEMTVFSQWFNSHLEEMGLHPLGNNLTNSANFTQLVTQAQHAASPHPASQMVAATIQKAASADGNSRLTIQLDPPDLGRVEVRMEFGKDKSMKAHLVIEKPETYLMLQRDAQLLERALQNAGLEPGQDGLGFELAQDGHEFGHDGGHDGSAGGHAGGGSGGEEASEIIEATMNWYVDPDTGLTRYDLLV